MEKSTYPLLKEHVLQAERIRYKEMRVRGVKGVRVKNRRRRPVDTESMKSQLYEMLAKVDTPEDARLLLDDLCTNKEVEQMAQRAYAAKLFLQGNTYAQIIEKTDISSATLSRVSRCINYGGGGYAKFVKRD